MVFICERRWIVVSGILERRQSGEQRPGATAEPLILVYGARAYNFLGLGLAWEEGIELNVLSLSAGADANDLGLRLPGIGRVTLARGG
jgi:hypothetical protein